MSKKNYSKMGVKLPISAASPMNLASSCFCDMNWRSLAVVLALILVSINLAHALSADKIEVHTGVTYNFTAQTTSGGDLVYLWTATDGSPMTSSDRTFRWIAPIVDFPKEATLTLTTMTKGGCKSIKELDLLILPYVAALSVSKIPSAAAANVGDTIVFTYIVKNTGNVTVHDLTLSDTSIGKIALVKTELAPGVSISANVSRLVTDHDLLGPMTGTVTALAVDPRGNAVSHMAEAVVTLNSLEPKIGISKNCIYSAPVMIGNLVTYTYNVTNQGGWPLSDINLTDLPNWGPNCLPIYQKGDGGNGILDPGESWWYECRYVVPDPSDYPRLHIMGGGLIPSFRLTKTIHRLLGVKSRLEIVMAGLRLSTSQFDIEAAHLSSGRRTVGGTSYTFYNYSNTVTEESFSKIKGPEGNLTKTIYADPITGALLTVQYAPDGKMRSEEIYHLPLGTGQYLKIDYDMPTVGYRTFTVIDYESGDTIVLIIDGLGNILNTKYKITPGYMAYEERYFLKNTATVRAKTSAGIEISDSDLFTLEVFRPLPLLSVTKNTESELVNPGGTLNYSIVYENTGGSEAHNVRLQEIYDSNLSFIWSDRTPDSGTKNRWTLGDLKVGESGKIRIETKVSASAIPGSEIKNQVELTSSENASAGALVNTIVSAVKLNITKIASAKSAKPGDPLSYIIFYENTGNEDAHGAVVRETYDMNLEFMESDPFPDNGTSDRWTLGNIKAGQSGEIKIMTIVSPSAKAGQLIKNVVDLTCREITVQALNYTTISGVELNITKTASSPIVEPESELTYTINYRNRGTMNQTDVIIHDYLDPHVDFVNFQSDPPLRYNSSGRHFMWYHPGGLAPGESGTIEILVKLKDRSFFPNDVFSIFNNYKIGSSQVSGTNATLETLVVHSLWIKKSADKGACNREENITYTINYGNTQAISAHDLSIIDILPEVDLISASPPPNLVNGNNLTWTMNDLGAHENGTIVVVVQIPRRAKANFFESSSVTGDGYVYVKKGFSTEEEKKSLINKATISGYYDAYPYKASSTSVVTVIGSDGTRINSIEHGSGHYVETARNRLVQENRSISLDKNTFAKYRETAFSLPGNRTVKYNSLWSDSTTAENRILGDKLYEKYQYVDTLNKSLSLQADMNQTVYSSKGDFGSGMVQIGYKKYTPGSLSLLQEIDHNYHGSFKVQESIDSYGESVKFTKSAVGKGFVSSDTRLQGLQGASEQGSGYYSSEETSQIGTVDRYTKAQYAPVSIMVGSQNLTYANLWEEKMWTRDSDKGLLISEQILHAHSIDKETLLQRSSLSTIGKFNGTMNIQLVKEGSRFNANLEESLVGSYQIDTTISDSIAPKHLYPHVNISKKALMQDEKTVLFLINISNDGNKLVKTLNVTDSLPEGLSFINSSIRAKVNGQIINWTIPTLDVGRMLTIKMRAKVDGGRRYYTNKVSVKAVSKDTIVEANNSTTFEAYYLPLPCCSNVYFEANTSRISSATPIKGYWGDWNPSTGFNMTSNMTECSQEMDSYYDELEKNLTACSCGSNYNVP